MIAGPFRPTAGARDVQAERVYRAAARLVRTYPERFSMRVGDDEIHIWRHRSTSSLRAFYVWLLIAFIAGAIAGALTVAAFGGGRSTASSSSPGHGSALTSVVDLPPARAALVEDDPRPNARAGYEAEPAELIRTHPPVAVRATPVPRTFVVAIAERHGVDGARFADVMHCESSLRPDAIGDGGAAVGIAQFHAPTWASSTRRYYGAELAPAMRLDPEIALEVAARKWAAEGPWAWTCAR